MTEKQTVEIVTTICMSYPSFEKLGADAIKGMVKIWAMLFADDDYSLVQLAVAKHISTNKWPPSVAEIREQMAQIAHPDLIPPDRAWALVQSASSTFGEFSGDKIMNKLPPLIVQAINAMGGWYKLWELRGSTGRGFKADAARIAFMDLYKPAYEREREMQMLPKSVSSHIVDIETVLEPAKRCIEDKRLEWRRLLNAHSLEADELEDGEEQFLIEDGLGETPGKEKHD